MTAVFCQIVIAKTTISFDCLLFLHHYQLLLRDFITFAGIIIICMSSIYNSISLVSSILIAALGILLVIIRIPRDGLMQRLRKPRIFLSSAYFLLAVSDLFRFLQPDIPTDDEAYHFVILFFASTQSMVFTYTLLIFIQPLYVTARRIILQALALGGVGIMGIILYSSGNEDAAHLFFCMAFLAYCAQITYYTLLFRKKYAKCLLCLQEYYCEEEDRRLRWVQWCFYSALSIGIGAAVFMHLPHRIFTIFIVLYTLFYLYFVTRFIDYLNRFAFVVYAMEQPTANNCKAPTKQTVAATEVADESILHQKEEMLKEALEQYIAAKGYTQIDIDNENIMQQLNADRATINHYFNNVLGMDFRTWRTMLRVEEAKKLIRQNPGMTMNIIGEKAGFSDKSNFSRQFKKFVGCSPTEYAMTQKATPDDKNTTVRLSS